MLNLAVFRKIKPVGSLDDWPSGSQPLGVDKKQDGIDFVARILKAIKHKEMSVAQISAVTGRSRAAVAKRLSGLSSSNKVTSKKRIVPGVSRSPAFYKAITC